MKTKIPSYSFFRILIVSLILYFLLITPTTTYMVVKNFPMFFGKGQGSLVQIDSTNKDIRPDSLTKAVNLGTPNNGITVSKSESDSTLVNYDIGRAGISAIVTNLIGFILALVIIGINIPFKVYLKRKRKNLKISPKLTAYCRKYLFIIPWFNSGALLFALLIRNMDNVFQHTESVSKTEHDLGINLMVISIISSFLIALFSFFWQQHSIHFRNLEYFFDKEELYKRQKKSFGIRMRGKFLMVQGITTLLPVSIIVFYIFMSISEPADFGVKKVSNEQEQILFGGYSPLLHEVINDEITLNEIASGSYINIVDMFFSRIGIFMGVIVTLIYIMFFVRWLTIQTTSPIKNLLEKMEKATDTKEYSYSLVRTRDELGQLTEGYNVMAEKIMNYIREVEEINRGLEEKVKERTAEIEAQRDEIEAQRDEIESQRDLVTDQKVHIEAIHKEVTDSINYATRLQIATLPDPEIFKNIISEHFVLFKPKDKVSGDFYWWAVVGNQLIITVADCTGHGVPGAFMSMLGSSWLREIIVKEQITSPDVILMRLREEIIHTLKQKGDPEEQKDGMDMAIVSLNMDTLKMQFAGANSPVFIVKREKIKVESEKLKDEREKIKVESEKLKDESEKLKDEGEKMKVESEKLKDEGEKMKVESEKLKVESEKIKEEENIESFQIETSLNCLYELKGDLMPVAIYESMEPFTSQEIILKRGDCIYMKSDGFQDQFGGSIRKKYLSKNLKELIKTTSHKPMNEQLEILNTAFENWKGEHEQIDDVTILGLKI